MRKLMLLAAMVAMVLVAAAPAFAQVGDITQVTDDDEFTVNTIGNQALFVEVDQEQNGDANAAAVDDSTAEAFATNEADIWVDQSLSVGGLFFVDDGDLDDDGILDDFEFVAFTF